MAGGQAFFIHDDEGRSRTVVKRFRDTGAAGTERLTEIAEERMCGTDAGSAGALHEAVG